MDFFEVIKTRASIRDYDPSKNVPRETILKILEAGRLAPSAANRQPWKFLIISSEKLLNKVRKCYQRPWFKDAPHILAVVGNTEESWVRRDDGYHAIETDLTIAMDHMILAAHNEGVATCWIAAFDNEVLRDSIGLNDNQVIFAITPLGYPHDNFKVDLTKNRKSIEEIVKFI